MNKLNAINSVNEKLDLKLNNYNTNWSNINANDIWSIEPNFQRQRRDLYLILNNNKTKKLHVFKIPANDRIFSLLYRRNDREVFRLLFEIDDYKFTETLKGIDFRSFHIDTIKYNY